MATSSHAERGSALGRATLPVVEVVARGREHQRRELDAEIIHCSVGVWFPFLGHLGGGLHGTEAGGQRLLNTVDPLGGSETAGRLEKSPLIPLSSSMTNWMLASMAARVVRNRVGWL
jgi:hypothetical protein